MYPPCLENRQLNTTFPHEFIASRRVKTAFAAFSSYLCAQRRRSPGREPRSFPGSEATFCRLPRLNQHEDFALVWNRHSGLGIELPRRSGASAGSSPKPVSSRCSRHSHVRFSGRSGLDSRCSGAIERAGLHQVQLHPGPDDAGRGLRHDSRLGAGDPAGHRQDRRHQRSSAPLRRGRQLPTKPRSKHFARPTTSAAGSIWSPPPTPGARSTTEPPTSG